jgi:hypothetical protein
MIAEVASGAAGVASKPESSAGRCEGSSAYSTYCATPSCIGSMVTDLMRTLRKQAEYATNRAASHTDDDI